MAAAAAVARRRVASPNPSPDPSPNQQQDAGDEARLERELGARGTRVGHKGVQVLRVAHEHPRLAARQGHVRAWGATTRGTYQGLGTHAYPVRTVRGALGTSRPAPPVRTQRGWWPRGVRVSSGRVPGYGRMCVGRRTRLQRHTAQANSTAAPQSSTLVVRAAATGMPTGRRPPTDEREDSAPSAKTSQQGATGG